MTTTEFEKVLEDEIQRLKVLNSKLVLELVFVLTGYGLLLWVDWKAAVGVFFIHWAINLKMARKERPST